MPLPEVDLLAENTTMENHYQLLELNSAKATLSDIRDAYKKLSLTCHPDKIRVKVSGVTPATTGRGGNSSASQEEQKAKLAAQEKWARIERAHQILSDEVTRGFYDIEAGFVPNTPEEHARIARAKRKEAIKAVNTMEETVAQNRAEEEEKNGLLILTARYGDLSATDLDQSEAISAPYIDVSVPLQCMVNDSALIINKHTHPAESKYWLEGFYDPSMGSNPDGNRLYIRYKFLGALHEVEYADRDDIAIPLQEHCIEGEFTLSGEEGIPDETSSTAFRSSRSSASNIIASSSASNPKSSSSRSRAKQQRQRYLLVTSVTSLMLLGAGVYFLKRQGVTMASAKSHVQVWTEWLRQALLNKLNTWAPNAPKSITTTTASSSSSSSNVNPAVVHQ